MTHQSSITFGKHRDAAKLIANEDGSIWRELGAVLVHDDGRIIVRPCRDANEADTGNLFAVAGRCLTESYHLNQRWEWHPELSAWASDIYRREPSAQATDSIEEITRSRPAHQTT